MEAKIVILPGDGIGPEIVAQAKRVLQAVADANRHTFIFEEKLIGGAAIDSFGQALPQDTLSSCRAADGILLGAVGGPKWDDPTSAVRPEQGLLGIRKALGLFANLRPVTAVPALMEASPLRKERLEGVDVLFVRE
ncbi:MAG: isocitrate/isopropylmalate family dehydrogenase, partial [Myxococcota bacterium]